MTALPIEAVLPDLCAALQSKGLAVLQAPPGAGKTTRVPLALMDILPGRILVLEPRRLATRAAAARMADTLGERLGQRVGYRMRGASEVGPETRIEVITEGILTRMLQDNPEMPGVGCIIFDEFHERALAADLGLALAWEVRQALRPDLALLVMSATLDADPVAKMLDAPVITSAGRSFPVRRIWRDRPPPAGQRLEAQVAGLVQDALRDGPAGGSVLAFLPGEGEIRRCAAMLTGAVPGDVEIRPLYGALPFAEQRAAIAPAKSGRKVVLATSIAETSLTIEDIRIVVDGGRARRSRFDPASGMARLVTDRVTKAEATQRAGRAGRVADGVAYANWTKGEEGGMQPFPAPEIASADLAGLALELALWGSADLAFLTPPPEGALAEARALLTGLGALEGGRITPHGRALAKMPLHPRLAHMVKVGGSGAAGLAGVLATRLPPGSVDLEEVLRKPTSEAKAEAKRLRKWEDGPARSDAQRLALAYPDRIGLRRSGEAPRWLLSGGKGARMEKGDALAGARLLVACDLDGDRTEARIRRALPLSEAELREVFGPQIAWQNRVTWSERDRRVLARRQEMLGAIALSDQRWTDAPPEALAQAALDGVQALGLDCLNWTKRARLLRARIAASGLRDVSDGALLVAAERWLLPHLDGVTDAAGLARLDPHDALVLWLGWEGGQDLERLAPANYTSPLGRKIPIDYGQQTPTISVRLQEVLGETTHPRVGEAPLRVELLSPAQRPIAITQDLPGFWTGSYADVRRDMRSQYPKHLWPEDPTAASPTLRAKPRR